MISVAPWPNHLADNPSLKAKFLEASARAYADAREDAYAETSIPEETFPAECPWAPDQLMAADFWPGSEAH